MKNAVSISLVSFGASLLLVMGLLRIFPFPDSGKWNKKEAVESNRNIDYRIEKIGKCDYVFWFNGYGSDMEHYNSCETCLERN